MQDVLRRHPALPAALGALRRGQLPAGLGAARRRPPGLPDGLRVADLRSGRHQPCCVLPLQPGAERLLQGPVPLLPEPPDHPGLPPLRFERHWLMRGSQATDAPPGLSLWLGQGRRPSPCGPLVDFLSCLRDDSPSGSALGLYRETTFFEGGGMGFDVPALPQLRAFVLLSVFSS